MDDIDIAGNPIDIPSCIPSNFDIREDAGDGDSLSSRCIEQINGKNTHVS